MSDAIRRLALFTLLVAVAGCASGGGAADGSPRARARMDVITKEQALESRATDALGIVETLRSGWLRERGSDSLTGQPTRVQVYFDDVRLGGVETLRSISLVQIGHIRYYDGVAASGRWGLGHGAGVIFVSSRPFAE